MALAAGSKLGPYEVISLIGAGGMGEVYKARDPRLDRSVAIKVLPTDVSTDPERRARFEREAHAIAALTHPRICTLHDIGLQDGSTYLVMEHLVGETLADRLHKGPLPLATALQIGVQIAEGLSAAHRAGIVHRDLKPSNVILTTTGAKLVDFGLAKLTGPGGSTAMLAVTGDPTKPMSLTARGTILGTLPYMAPEQIEGLDADPRTDLWALGAIMYEMVTGTRAFDGSTPASLIGAILEREPVPLAARQPLTPSVLEAAVRRCLAKQPDDRWDTAHDFAAELRWIPAGALPTAATAAATPWRRWVFPPLLVLGGALAATLAIGMFQRWHQAQAAPVIRASLGVEPAEALGDDVPYDWTPGGSRTALTWTPDGRSLVYVGWRHNASRLYVRALDREDGRVLSGTDGAYAPAVSPNGRWVAFWADGQIAKVPITGGPREILAASPYLPTRIAWANNGDLIYDAPSGILRLGAGGPRSLTHTSLGQGHILASFLPADRALLYTFRQRVWTWGDEDVVAQDLSTGTSKVLLHDAADARYLPSGHLLFLRRGELFAAEFDPNTLELRGPPIAVLEHVAQALVASNSGGVTGAGQFAVASTGALAWVPGAPVDYPQSSLAIVNRRGQPSGLPAPARSYGPVLRVSPDGHLLAVTVRTLTDFALCVYDLSRGTLTTLANKGELDWPTWAPDGERLAFQSRTGGRSSLLWVKPDGSDSSHVITESELIPSSWNPKGNNQLALLDEGQIRLLALDHAPKAVPQPALRTQQPAFSAEFSPNGRWLAYAAYDSASGEVYVQPYPGPGPRLQISTHGGTNPAWNPKSNELFYLADVSTPTAPDKRVMMVVAVNDRPTLTVGVPQPLFEFRDWKEFPMCGPTRCYDVAPDGQHFFAVLHPALPVAAKVTHVNLVLSWLDELKNRTQK